MTSYQPGEIVLVSFPFTGSSGNKRRPALVIWDAGDEDVILARVTTQSHGSPFDIPITEWKLAGLLATSTVRLHKLATIDKQLVERRLGKLAPADRSKIGGVLAMFSSGW